MEDISIIPDFPDYLISSNGEVYDTKREIEVPLFIDDRGYARISVNNNGVYKQKKIHRLLGEAFIPNPNNYRTVDHINREKLDNRLENLRWVPDTVQAQNRNDFKNNKSGIKHISQGANGYWTFRYVRDYKTTQYISKNKEDVINARDEFIKTGILPEPKSSNISGHKYITIEGERWRVRLPNNPGTRYKTLEEAIAERDENLKNL